MTALIIDGSATARAETTDLVTPPAASVRVAVRIDASQWAPDPEAMLAQYLGPTGVRLFLNSSQPALNWIDSGAGGHSEPALAPLPFTAGLRWIMAELIFDDGSGDHTVEWAWSGDNTDDADTVVWTSLGVATIPGTTDVDPTGGVTTIGGSGQAGEPSFEGYYLAAQIDVDAVTVAEPIFAAEAAGPVAFTDAEGVDWLGAGTAAIIGYPQPVEPVLLAGAARGAVANAPLVQLATDILNPLRIRVLRVPALAEVVSLSSTLGDQAREQRNAQGSGTVTLLGDDPAVPLIRKYDLVQHILESQVAVTTIVDDIVATDENPSEEAGERVTYSGPGHISLLRLGLVYPTRGVGRIPIERDRVWNWTSPIYDDGFWPLSSDVGPGDGDLREPGLQEGRPSVFPNIPGITWRGAQGDTQAFAPGGPVFYRGTITLPPGTRQYIGLCGADNHGDFYADGVKFATLPYGKGPPNWLDGVGAPIELSGGDVLFAARVFNVGPPYPTASANPVGLLFALAALDDAGEIDEIIGVADGTWRALGRPAAEPGMTPSRVARSFLEEWQARAALAGHDIPLISLTCDDLVDSDGQPWAQTPNIATKVGNDGMTFFTEIAATYWEMRMRPASLELDLWRKGTLPFSGVTYARAPAGNPNAGNIRSKMRRSL